MEDSGDTRGLACSFGKALPADTRALPTCSHGTRCSRAWVLHPAGTCNPEAGIPGHQEATCTNQELKACRHTKCVAPGDCSGGPGASVTSGTDHSLTACPGVPFPTHFLMPWGLPPSSSALGEAPPQRPHLCSGPSWGRQTIGVEVWMSLMWHMRRWPASLSEHQLFASRLFIQQSFSWTTAQVHTPTGGSEAHTGHRTGTPGAPFTRPTSVLYKE